MTSTLTRCARAACQKYIGQGGIQHRYLPWRYCLACARKINEGVSHMPGYAAELPFDLTAIKEDT